MPDHDITLGELARRLEAADRRWDERISQILAEMREDRRQNAEQFLRRDVYEANRKADGDDVAEVRKRQDESEKFRRQAILSASLMILGIVASIILSLAGIPGGPA